LHAALAADHITTEKVRINLAYATSTDKVHAFCQGLRTLALEHPATRKEAIFAGLYELSASSIDLLFICHFDVRDFGSHIKARHELLLDVVTLASRLNVDFAYPTRTIHMVQPPAATNHPRPLRAAAEFNEAEQFGEAEARAILKAHLPRQD
jgi:MscS family membrane protein